MKKTLIALATLAAAGGAFAQSTVTLSGAYAAGYETTRIAGVRTGGLGTDTAAVKFSATEDLGGGMTASAYVSAGGLVRSKTALGATDGVGGENAGLTLAGGFGTIDLRTIESAGSGLTALGAAGAPGYDLHGKVFSANANLDQVAYTLPAFGPIKVSVNYVDRGGATEQGLNAGSVGVSASQPSYGVAVSYTDGGLAVAADYTSWTRKADANVTTKNNNDRIRISGKFDLGVAAIGAGYETFDDVRANRDRKDYIVGVAVPLGAAKIGLHYGKRDNGTAGGADVSGTSFGASYALSKRTAVDAHYASWKAKGAASSDTGFRVLVGHSF